MNKVVTSLIRKIRKPNYETLNRIEVLAANLEHNFDYLKSLQPDADIMPVLKSNAYGHGLVQVCQILEKAGAKIVAVDSFPEAQIACRYFSGRVLILGEMPIKAYRYAKLKKAEFCVYNSETLRALAEMKKKPVVHLFSNSGMNREGIQDMEKFLDENKGYLDRVEIRGFCSHLADAEEEGSALTKRQLDKFFSDLDILHKRGIFPDTVHLGNSAGIFTLHDKRLTAFRAGLAFYGYSPFPEGHPESERAKNLKPALRLISKIVSVQKLKPGDSVSYNARFVAPSDMYSAVVPFGYYEGLSRKLSNQAVFRLMRDKREIKIAGNVCMNLCCLDLGDREASLGDEVELISVNDRDSNSIINLSKISQNIPYESLVALRDNIRREVIWP